MGVVQGAPTTDILEVLSSSAQRRNTPNAAPSLWDRALLALGCEPGKTGCLQQTNGAPGLASTKRRQAAALDMPLRPAFECGSRPLRNPRPTPGEVVECHDEKQNGRVSRQPLEAVTVFDTAYLAQLTKAPEGPAAIR